MRKTLKGLLIFLIFKSFTACLSPDNIRLDENEKKEMVEQLFIEEARALQPKAEKGCEDNYYRMVSKATDSLVNVYLDSLNRKN